jgi:hypothetical protein
MRAPVNPKFAEKAGKGVMLANNAGNKGIFVKTFSAKTFGISRNKPEKDFPFSYIFQLFPRFFRNLKNTVLPFVFGVFGV